MHQTEIYFFIFLWNNIKYGVTAKKFMRQKLKNNVKIEFGVNGWSKTTL